MENLWAAYKRGDAVAHHAILSDDYRAVHPDGTLHPPRPTGQEIAAAPINQYSLTHLQAVPIATMQRSSLIAEVAVSSGGSPVTVKFAVGEVWAKLGARVSSRGYWISLTVDVVITTCPSSARAQLTVSTSALLVPPLVQPRFSEFPLGVRTVTFTAPGPEISPVVSFTVNFLSVRTFALRTFPLMTASDAATKLPPFTVTRTPCCTCAKVIVLGASDPISGAGLALPQNGFRVLLPQPARNKRASRTAKDKPKVREDMVMLLIGWVWKGSPV